ncbi:MAG: FAD:protein FMN transferase [Hyphomonadaceae bacterium]|nr:FAD:protein FMN transferase [Hyphomonadaceae bacterium]
MGTTWSTKAVAPTDFDARAAEAALRAALDAIIAQMSGWAPDSTLSQFNAAGAGATYDLPAHFHAVLQCALDVARRSDGAFDPSLGALVDLWGFGAHPVAGDPAAREIADALAQSGWAKLTPDGSRLKQPGGLRLDLSGIAKGYAVDELARVLSERGLNSFLVEIGGELRGAGVKPDAQPWWVDIEEPPGSPRAPILLALHNLAIATSGDYQRFDESSGRRISHTIDPRTGRPLESSPASVSVIHPTCMLADAYATALMVMGVEDGLRFATTNALAARFVRGAESGFEEILTPAFAAMLEE